MRRRILLNQHIGKPAMPIVQVGDEVKRGQKIAAADGLSANIFASYTGVVDEVSSEAIIINAKEEQPDTYEPIEASDDLLEMVENAGVVGAGGAGFPTHIKLDVKLTDGYVILNAAECEPILKHNIDYIEKNPKVIVDGLKYVMEMTQAKKIYIAIKPKHKKALIALGRLITSEEAIEFKYLPNIYPAGDERVIVRETLGVSLEPGQLPLEANAVVCNVETVKNIYFAIAEQKPVISKDLTVGGRVKGASDGVVYFDVPIGITMGELIEITGGYEKNHGEIISGGPFTGRPTKKDTPITKTTGGCIVSMPFYQERRSIGLLECECGAQEERLTEIAEQMGAKVVAVEKCKRMVEVNGRYRCDKPGECPGQTEKVLALKKAGAQAILAGACED